MTDQPAASDRQMLSAESAAEQRAMANRLAAALEDIAANGLPRAEDCTPWETLRERRLAELAAQGGHAG
jgi:hypothetical protein